MIGVQLGGAIKNVIAIGAGISDGMGFGANARTALITRGIAEITRLGISMGANTQTFMGMSGLGDLVLTCTDNQSRNRRFGLMLGKGTDSQQAMDEIGQVVEGFYNTKETYLLAQRQGVEMPITEQIYQMLFCGKSAQELALYLQNQISVAFDVDIHPAAKIGHGIMFDHATGIVVGETSVIENDVSILQGVTLGGTGKESGDRHPKVREGVMIGAGAKVLGNIEVGKYAKIGANSVVLQPVPEYATAAGVPARIVGKDKEAKPAFEMNQYFIDDDINLNI